MILSFIGIVESNGNIKGVGLEFPNVISQTGQLLINFYNREISVRNLIKHGIIKHLADCENNCIFSDKSSESEQYSFSEIQKLKHTYKYIYLYDSYKSTWFFMHENRSNQSIYKHPDKILLAHALELQDKGLLFNMNI